MQPAPRLDGTWQGRAEWQRAGTRAHILLGAQIRLAALSTMVRVVKSKFLASLGVAMPADAESSGAAPPPPTEWAAAGRDLARRHVLLTTWPAAQRVPHYPAQRRIEAPRANRRFGATHPIAA